MPCLPGMKSIANYCNRSESTVLQWIRTLKFPATKFSGSWESDTELVDAWRRGLIKNDVKKRNGKGKNW